MFQKFALLIVLATFSSFASSESPRWEWVTPSEVVLLRSYPDGYEQSTNTFLYLCRAYGDDGRWMPGKLRLSSGSVTCEFGVYGIADNRTDFQMLISDPGTTAWVPYTEPLDGGIPANAIPVGVGTWGWSTNLCYLNFEGREIETRDNVEILTLSAYGQ